MAILQAYFDESGKLQDKANCVVFGGLIGKLDEVSVFSNRWKDLLGSEFNHIHMKDAMRFQGAFKGVKESVRNEVLVECAKIAQTESAMLFVSAMDKRDFLGLSRAQQDKLKNPTYGGFETCIRMLAKEFRSHDLHIWYDESEEYAGTCLKLYQKLKSMHTDFARRLPSLTFANDEKYPGLQAADMVAYSTFVVRRDGEAAPPVVREIYSIIHKEHMGKKHLLYAEGASLGSGTIEA